MLSAGGIIADSARSWRFGWIAVPGTMLAATTHSLKTVEVRDTEYGLALLRSGGFDLRNISGFPNPKHHNTLNL
jgi:hypothetical protein